MGSMPTAVVLPLLILVAGGGMMASAACGANCHSDEGCAAEGGAGFGNGTGGAVELTAAEAYCDCMLLTCHDAYHDQYGPDTDEPAARANCLAEAGALPVAGMAVDTGNFIECRQHHCDLGVEDEVVCGAAIGEGVCAP